MTAVALIPSYQPDERLVDMVHALHLEGMSQIVVDDGSGEDYLPVFEDVEHDAQVIRYDTNRGKGYAIKQGLRFIQQHYPADTVVVTVDGDGQHDPADVIRCAEAAQAQDSVLVLGCRSFDEAGVPLRSRMGNVFTRGVYRLVSGAQLSDTQTGLRAFPAALISFLVGIGGNRYEYEMNVLMACPAQGIAFQEVPIRTIYEDDNAGSHFRPVRDSVRIYASILEFVMASFASFLVDYALFAILSTMLVSFGGAGVALANIGARLVSATFNFAVNRRFVFHSKESLYITLVRYALVAGFIMICNTFVVLFLVQGAGCDAMLSKLAAECLFFFVSWVLQNRVVFQERSY